MIMNGVECLREELLKRGFTKQQAESKTVVEVLEILAESNGEYRDMAKIMSDLKELREKKDRMYATYVEYERKANALKQELDKILEMLNAECDRRYKETVDQVDALFKALAEAETPEIRDALKAAHMFVNSVDVDTKYDNTAFIIGLASILSRGNTAPIDSLRKINKKIPQLEVEASPCTIYGVKSKEYEIREKKPRRL